MNVEEGRENAENGVKKRYIKGRRKKGDMKSYERRRKEEREEETDEGGRRRRRKRKKATEEVQHDAGRKEDR